MTTHDDTLESAAPTPQDWGFPAKPNRANQACWDRQELFLEAYRHTSLLTHAARAVGISAQCVDKWLSRDVYSFQKRMELARREYCDSVRQMIQTRLSNPQGNRGSDILLMFEAKAVMPEMYREEVRIIGAEKQIEMLDKLREMATRERQRQLEAPSIEGEFREVRDETPPRATE
jgi:hypothetical protein